MVEQPDVDIFQKSSVLQGLGPAERRALFALLRRRRYHRQEVVFHQGDAGDTLHIVRRGHLKVLIPGEAGEEAVLNIVGPGDLLGELTLLDGKLRSATVVALEEVETATLSRADFFDLLHREPAVVEALLASLVQTIRRLSDDVTNLMSLDLRRRLAKKLLELAGTHGSPIEESIEIQVPLTQEELAGMIGATRPRVNKLLGFFEDQGLITRRGRRIVIAKPEALRGWVNFSEDW